MSNPASTVAEYDALLLEKQALSDKLNSEMRELRRERDKLHARDTAAAKLASFTEVEREAIREASKKIGADGVPSGERVGNPGA